MLLPDWLAPRVVVDEAGCWLWQGHLTNGYGKIQIGGRGKPKKRAHRWVYEQMVGPIPEGLDLDHLCRVRNCVRPDHLDPKTRSANLRCGNTGKNARLCPHGVLGLTKCRDCQTAKRREWRERQKAAA